MNVIYDYSFREVNVLPSSGKRFFQLFRRGTPLPFVFSESHLEKSFGILFSHDSI